VGWGGRGEGVDHLYISLGEVRGEGGFRGSCGGEGGGGGRISMKVVVGAGGGVLV